MIEPGLYELAIEDYHRDPCPEPSLSNSLIPWLLQAPAKARVRHPRLVAHPLETESRRMDLGSVAHKLLLGRGRDITVVEADNYRTKAAQEARDAARAEGHIPILMADLKIAEDMHTAAVRQLIAFGCGDVFGSHDGQSELAMVWQDASGAWGRNLIDRLLNHLPTWEIWDYKTTDRSARPEDAGLGIHVVEMGYDTQFAMQERGIFTLFPQLAGRLRFRLLFQETEDPYLISVVEPDEATMTIARKKVAMAFALWAACVKNQAWPGYTPKIVKLRHAEHLANRWLAREIADMADEGEERAPHVPTRKVRMHGKRQELIERRRLKREKDALALKDGQTPMDGG